MDHKKASLLDHKQVARFLETDLKSGLSQSEAKARLKRFGRNKLAGGGGNGGPKADLAGGGGRARAMWAKLTESQLGHFLRQLLNPLIQLLLICALISASIGQYENSISVLVSCLLVCAISHFQERRADASLAKLSQQAPSTCQVIRGGRLLELEAELLVPGDLVHLFEGQRVPADIRLFKLQSLTINEANLTGETRAQCKRTEATDLSGPQALAAEASSWPPASAPAQEGAQEAAASASLNATQQQQQQQATASSATTTSVQVLHERRVVSQNLALMGTVVESGHSYGLVFATGKWTRYGEVFALLKGAQHPRSPLQLNIDQLSVHLVVAACCIIALVSIVGIVQRRAALEVAYYAISLAVTAIPEGLPVVVAVIMALGVIRLGRQRTIVKSMGSIETLGCLQVLCLDKTGTLTRNDMTLTTVVTSELHALSSDELEQLMANNEECITNMTFNKFGGKMYSICRLMEAATLCNNAQLADLDEPSGAGGGPTSSASAPNASVASSSSSSSSFDENAAPQVSHPDDESFATQHSAETTLASEGAASSATTNGGSSGGQESEARSQRRLVGQATECAILEAALRLGFGDSRAKFERISELPFSSSTRRMAVQCRRRCGGPAHSSEPQFYVKGAWEEILRDCQFYYERGLVRARTQTMWADCERLCARLGAQGLRVLALATGPALEQLTFVGLLGISNSLRAGSIETVGKLRDKFHINVKMITGDSRPTAAAVGRSLGLLPAAAAGLASPAAAAQTHERRKQRGRRAQTSGWESSSAESKLMMSGAELQQLLLNTDLDQALKGREIMARSVFYRVDPIQKANIVSKLQELNQVVGMTGDGVNDVISLKRANLSLVMGSGADVCKELADIVMVEDDLSVLLTAVLEGKAIYHKIHNFLAYQISISLAIVTLIAISFGAQCEPPFSVAQLLYINLLADGPPAQSLAMERLSENELGLWPRNVNDPLLSCRLLGTLLTLTLSLLALNGALYDYLLDAATGQLDKRARALLFACFVFCTTFAALSLRSKFKTIVESRPRGNLELLACCALVVALQVLITQIAPLNSFFQLESVPYVELLYVFLYASIVLIIMDGLKLCLRLADYARRLLLKAAHNFQVPNYGGRQQTYSTGAAAADASAPKRTRLGPSNSDYLAALKLGGGGGGAKAAASATPKCTAVTPLAAPRTLFGNLMPTTPRISVTSADSAESGSVGVAASDSAEFASASLRVPGAGK